VEVAVVAAGDVADLPVTILGGSVVAGLDDGADLVAGDGLTAGFPMETSALSPHIPAPNITPPIPIIAKQPRPSLTSVDNALDNDEPDFGFPRLGLWGGGFAKDIL
jgi:hypothetical protein